MRGDAARRAQACGAGPGTEKDGEEAGERSDDPVRVPRHEQRAEDACAQCGDEAQTEITRFDRNALAELRQTEDGELRREGELHDERDGAGVRDEPFALGSGRGDPKREQREERERAQRQMAHRDDQMPVDVPAEAHQLGNEMDGDSA